MGGVCVCGGGGEMGGYVRRVDVHVDCMLPHTFAHV